MNKLEKDVDCIAEEVQQLHLDSLLAQIEAADDKVSVLASLSDEDMQLVLDETEKRESAKVRVYGCPVIDLIPDDVYFQMKADPANAKLLEISEAEAAKSRLFRMKCGLRREAEAVYTDAHAALRAKCQSDGRKLFTPEECAEQKAISARFKEKLKEIQAMTAADNADQAT